MRALCIAAFVAATLSSMPASPVHASPPSQYCQFAGSDIGYDEAGNAYFVGDAQGTSTAFGTASVKVVLDPVTLQALIPGIADATEFKGTWRRIDGRSFRTAVVGLAMDANQNVLAIIKMSGVTTFDDSCQKETIADVLDLFEPNRNPFTDSSYFSMELPVHDAYRMPIP